MSILDHKAFVCPQSVWAAWGEAVVEMLSYDSQKAFPGVGGFSSRNMRDMKRFYLAYSDKEFWRQAVAKLPSNVFWGQPVAELDTEFLRQLVVQIPWGHHLLILNKMTDADARLYYINATAKFGWSRNVLLNQIKAKAYERALKEKKTHNFPSALPETLAELADETLKSSYNLEFPGIHREALERELETNLIERLQDFILELGYGYCFIGRQKRLAVGQKEYFIDLLFYHRFLKALVGVAGYQLTKKLPRELKGKLPSEQQLRTALISTTRNA